MYLYVHVYMYVSTYLPTYLSENSPEKQNQQDLCREREKEIYFNELAHLIMKA